MGVGEEAHKLAAVQPPPAGAQPERGHERPERGSDHEERSRSASQMPPQSAAGASAMTRSSGIMLGTVAPGVAQGVSRPIACHPVRRYGVAPWRCISNGDRAKAEANRCKHKVTFDEAVSVFYDECLSLFIRNEMRQPASSVHDSPRRTSANGMKAKRSNEAAQMRAEYNFDYSKAERGRYYKRLLAEGSNVVVLDRDVAKEFPDSASVNKALRSVIKSKRSRRPTRTRERSRAG